MQHRIDLLHDTLPYSRSPYQYAAEDRQFLQTQVKKLLCQGSISEHGLLRPGGSPNSLRKLGLRPHVIRHPGIWPDGVRVDEVQHRDDYAQKGSFATFATVACATIIFLILVSALITLFAMGYGSTYVTETTDTAEPKVIFRSDDVDIRVLSPNTPATPRNHVVTATSVDCDVLFSSFHHLDRPIIRGLEWTLDGVVPYKHFILSLLCSPGSQLCGRGDRHEPISNSASADPNGHTEQVRVPVLVIGATALRACDRIANAGGTSQDENGQVGSAQEPHHVTTQKKKQEQEADAAKERNRHLDTMTLEEIHDQLQQSEKMLATFKEENHKLLMQLKKALHEEETRERALGE
ncbi:hypothetical protein HPB49_011397 [Dermacentor silvarum]|uniref:Uncharacterized protein n=1 Tax=Dermacentor silvarum TaxID=543639 RepID=A0ACB8DZF1_DERSI|nr:hypothetical protein HPB49_011397 [Dermacentor silvarum]